MYTKELKGFHSSMRLMFKCVLYNSLDLHYLILGLLKMKESKDIMWRQEVTKGYILCWYLNSNGD